MSTSARDFYSDWRRWWWLMLVPSPLLAFAMWEAIRYGDNLALLYMGGPALAMVPVLWFALRLRRFSVGPTAIEVKTPFQRKILCRVPLSDIAASVFRWHWPYRMGWLCVYGKRLSDAGAEAQAPLLVLDTRGLSSADLEWLAQYPPLKVQPDNAT